MRAALLLILLLVSTKEEFIASLGGPSAPVGTQGLTAAELADRLDACIASLVNVGYRDYWHEDNRRRFWRTLMGQGNG